MTTLYQIFEESYKKNKNKIAVIHGDESYTYQQLMSNVSELSAHIKNVCSYNSGSGLIAIYLERGYQQVVAMLSILKCGFAYLPLSIDWPMGRVSEILHESQTQYVVISRKKLNSISLEELCDDVTFMVTDDLGKEDNGITTHDSIAPLASVLPSQAAYVIYTSGSTGKPKGVTISHDSALNTIRAINQKLKVTQHDSSFCISDISFDLSVYDVFGLLMAGGSIIFPQDALRAPSWIEDIKKHSVTIWNSVPQLASLLIEHVDKAKNNIDSIRFMLLSGDWISSSFYRNARNILTQNCKIYSLGGATEGSIWSIWHPMTEKDESLGYVPYGTPLPNQKMYVLNKFKQQLPPGIPGEIYIGGAGVAIGYWNDKNRTQGSFINHEILGKIYKTGDLGVWKYRNKKIFIKFLGRIDRQVKFHGYRIELEGIAKKIHQLSDLIKSATLKITEQHGNQYLVCYFCAAEPIKGDVLREKLSRHVPHYMCPDYFVQLESMPLTANGKINFDALPEPNFIGNETGKVPCSELHIKLANIIKNVLHVERLFINDNIIKLGGNSLSLIRIANDIELYLNCNIDMASFLQNPTIESIAALVENKSTDIKPHIRSSSNYIPTYQQLGLYFIEKTALSSDYAIPMVLKLNPKLINLQMVEQALLALINRHSILRARFHELGNGQVKCQIQPEKNALLLKKRFFRHTDDLYLCLAKDSATPFNLSKSVVQYFSYENESEVCVMLCVHHIVFDGWSMEIFLSQLNDMLTRESETISKGVRPSQLDYSCYAQSQKDFLNEASTSFNKQMNYWQSVIKTIQPQDMYADKGSLNSNTTKGGVIRFSFEKSVVELVRMLCQQRGLRLFNFFAAAFAVLLQRYSGGGKQTVFGFPVSGRNNQAFDHVIGYFVNTLVLKHEFDKCIDMTVIEFIEHTQRLVNDCLKNSDLPFNYLADSAQTLTRVEDNPLFQYMLSVQNFKNKNYKAFDVVDENKFYTPSKFNFNITIDDQSDTFDATINYKLALYSKKNVERLIDSFKVIINEFLAGLETKKISEISAVHSRHFQPFIRVSGNTSIITKQMNTNQVCDLQGKAKLPDKDINKRLHDLFFEHAAQYPNRVAVSDESGDTTYGELYNAVTQVTNKLLNECEEAAEQPIIGVYLKKGWLQPCACLSILAMGGAYLPLNRDWPFERIKKILIKANVKVVLCSDLQDIHDIEQHINDLKLSLIELSGINKKTVSPFSLKDYDSNRLAYVIFTSGSTGMPKGCMLSHRGVMNTVIDINTHYNITHKSRVLALADLSFDQSVYDIFGILTAGGCVVYPSPDHHKNPQHWYELCSSNSINVWNSVPMLLFMFIEYLQSLPDSDQKALVCSQFSFIMLSGEAFPLNLVKPALKTFPEAKLVNSGGATECSIWSIWYEINQYDESWTSTPYGYAMTNQALYVLDENFNYSPIGVVGELFIAGIGVGLGYINNKETTEKSFFYCDKIHRYMYRTGDLVRINPAGYIEYIGRKDFQIKLHGYRIELGEIEFHLDSIPAIKKSTALVKEEALVAYVELLDQKDINTQYLFDILKEKLPDYMLPNQITVLDQLPRSLNGKIDKKALELLSVSKESSENIMVEPHTNSPLNMFENVALNIWKGILDCQTLTVNDSFFASGGNSLTAMKLIIRLNNNFNVDLSIRDFFKNPDFKSFMNQLYNSIYHKNYGQKSQNIVGSNVSLTRELFSHAQLRVLQMEELLAKERIPLYNIPVIYHFSGHIEYDAINYALNKILSGNKLFRLRISRENNTTSAHYEDATSFHLESCRVVSNKEELEIKKFINNYFDVFNAEPLVKFKLLSNENNKHKLLIVVHHIISDGWTIQLFNHYFMAYYNEYINSVKIRIDKDGVYDDYVQLESEYLTTNKHIEDLAYWGKQYETHAHFRLDEWIEQKNLSTHFNAKKINFELDPQVSLALNTLCKERSRSLFSFLLSCFYLSMNVVLGIDDIAVLSGTSGRYTEELEYILGMFVNGVLLHGQPTEHKNFEELWSSSLANCSEAFHHQKTPIDIVIDSLSNKEHLKIPDIAFLMNNQNNLFDFNDESNNIRIIYEYPELSYSNFTVQWTTNITEEQGLSFNVLYKDFVPDNIIYSLKKTYLSIISQIIESYQKKQDCLIKNIHKVSYPLKLLPFQETYWFGYSKNPDSRSDIEPIIYKIKSNVEGKIKDRFVRAVHYFFGVLHTHAFGSIVQAQEGIFLYNLGKNNNYVNVCAADNENLNKQLINQPLDLTNNEFVRLIIYQAPEVMTVTLLVHHLIIDARTYIILMRVIESFVENNKNVIEIDHQATLNFVLSWHKKLKKITSLEKHCQFWRQYLLNKPLSMPFPIKNISKYSVDGEYEYFSFTIGKNKLVRFSELLALYAITLYELTNNTSMPILFARDLRKKHQDNILGSFVNLVPQVVEIDTAISIHDNISEISSETKKIMKFSSYPFSYIVNDLRQNQRYDQNSFNIGFLNTHTRSSISTVSKELSRKIEYKHVRNWPISLDISLEYEIASDNKLIARVHYRNSLFTSAFIRRLINTFKNYVTSYYNDQFNPNIGVGNYVLEERLKSYSMKAFPLKQDPTSIIDVFENIVRQHPNDTAVCSGADAMTYVELHSISTCVAVNLTQLAKSGDKIIVSIDRSIRLPALILGIFKANMVYVPVDPTLPELRKKYIVENSGASLIITEEHFENVFQEYQCTTPDSIFTEANSQLPCIDPNSDAYIIYTSGTTGQPKGVIIQHKSVTALINSCKQGLAIQQGDIWSCFHSYSFDFSIFEILGPLLTGGKLALLLTNEIKDSSVLWASLKKHQVTILSQTPTSFQMLSMIDERKSERLSHLKLVVFGGEILKHLHIKTWIKKYNLDDVALYNLYGITETTVHNTIYKIQPSDVKKYNILPIGKGLQHVGILLMGPDGNKISPEHDQMIGEILVTGHSLAREYLNKDQFTREKFISIGNARYYKSGDLGLYSDRKLFCIGRNDNQIKLRGHRIELGEIENAIAGISSVKNFVLLTKVRESGIELFLFVLLDRINTSKLMDTLSDRLPAYMLPDKIVAVDKFKYNENNKIDKSYLSKRYLSTSIESTQVSHEIDKSSNLYKKLFKIWCEVLDTNNIDYDAPFLIQGGTSFSAVVLSVAISKSFNKKINLSWVFRYPSFYDQYYQLNADYSAFLGNDYIPIKEFFIDENSQKTLFLIHPGHSGSEAYCKLVNHLKDRKISIYGVESYNLHHHDWISSVEELAVKYVDEILSINRQGELYLAGWSYGGILAFEVARILHARGVIVKNLIIIDSHILSSLPSHEFKNLLDSTRNTFQSTSAYKVLPVYRGEYILSLINSELNAMYNYHPILFKINSLVIKASKQNTLLTGLNSWEQYLRVVAEEVIDGDHFSIMSDNGSLNKIATAILSTIWAENYE